MIDYLIISITHAYYAARAKCILPRKFICVTITTLQILQQIIGLFITALAYKIKVSLKKCNNFQGLNFWRFSFANYYINDIILITSFRCPGKIAKSLSKHSNTVTCTFPCNSFSMSSISTMPTWLGITSMIWKRLSTKHKAFILSKGYRTTEYALIG